MFCFHWLSHTENCLLQLLMILKNMILLIGGYVKSIVTLGWSIWTCNSKSMQVYADQGSLLGSQEEAADLASRLTAAEQREAVLKAALSDEQASHQSEARLAAARDVKASADLQAAAEKVIVSHWAA